MQNIDDLLKQQRELIIQMDQHHQRQMKSLQDRISKVEAQISFVSQNQNEPNNLPLSKKDLVQRSDIVLERNVLVPHTPVAAPSPSQDKLPRLIDQGGHF